MGMNIRNPFSLIGLILLTVFLLAVVWEFVVEELIEEFFAISPETSLFAHRWEEVILVVFFAGTSLIVLTLLLRQRKQVQETLILSEERLRHIVDTSPFGISIVSRANRKRLYVNHHFVEMLGGRSDEEILKWPAVESYVDPSKRDQNWAAFERDDVLPSTEEQRKRLDGTTWWCLTDWRPVVFEGEEAVINWHYDITELETAKEARERLSQAVETVPVGIALFDSDDRMFFFNSRYGELMEVMADILKPGVTFEEMIRTMVERQPVKDARGREEEFIQERIKHHRNPTGPFDIRRDNMWLLANETRLADGSIFTIITDITERKRMEEALVESEEKHRHFSADVAHELRTPLAVLRSHLDNLENTKTNQSLIKDVDAMSRLVSQLLATTRLDSLTINPSDEADLQAIGIEVAKYLGPLAIKEGRSIEVTGTEKPVIVRGNDDALEMAVRNLVENAIRYSARETVVTIHVSDNPAISVINHGRGISPEQQKVIFQRFKRADRREGGAGLGLSIVQRVVEAHQATIDVSDAPGGGAVFKISFPSHKSLKVVSN